MRIFTRRLTCVASLKTFFINTSFMSGVITSPNPAHIYTHTKVRIDPSYKVVRVSERARARLGKTARGCQSGRLGGEKGRERVSKVTNMAPLPRLLLLLHNARASHPLETPSRVDSGGKSFGFFIVFLKLKPVQTANPPRAGSRGAHGPCKVGANFSFSATSIRTGTAVLPFHRNRARDQKATHVGRCPVTQLQVNPLLHVHPGDFRNDAGVTKARNYDSSLLTRTFSRSPFTNESVSVGQTCAHGGGIRAVGLSSPPSNHRCRSSSRRGAQPISAAPSIRVGFVRTVAPPDRFGGDIYTFKSCQRGFISSQKRPGGTRGTPGGGGGGNV